MKKFLDINFGNDWNEILAEEFHKPYWGILCDFLEKEYKKYTVYPRKEDIFTALEITSYKGTKVVILGQDPYHESGQAHGLAFSVPDGVRMPSSLRNIYKELQVEYGSDIRTSGNLTHWAEQGILLLNTTLTVREGVAGSHAKCGWRIFTDAIIKALNQRQMPVIFMLWGNHAQKKAELIDTSRHYVLTAAHPSPLSAHRGFFGCGHFVMANKMLRMWGVTEIEW